VPSDFLWPSYLLILCSYSAINHHIFDTPFVNKRVACCQLTLLRNGEFGMSKMERVLPKMQTSSCSLITSVLDLGFLILRRRHRGTQQQLSNELRLHASILSNLVCVICHHIQSLQSSPH